MRSTIIPDKNKNKVKNGSSSVCVPLGAYRTIPNKIRCVLARVLLIHLNNFKKSLKIKNWMEFFNISFTRDTIIKSVAMARTRSTYTPIHKTQFAIYTTMQIHCHCLT